MIDLQNQLTQTEKEIEIVANSVKETA